MTPDTPEVEQILGYILGFCLDHYGLELHAACFMSNHYHLDVTDPYGQFPAFKCKFNSLVAKALNAHRGRFDCFWSADAPCDVELVSDEDVVDRMAYTLANPVTAGLVRRAGRWPGFTTAGDAFGTQLKFSRPVGYFDSSNPNVPDEVSVTLVRPKVMLELSDAEFQELLEDKVRMREVAAGAELRAHNRRFLGEARVLRQRWQDRPGTREPRFETRPRIAASSSWARVAAEQRDRDWEAEYAAAWEAQLRREPAVFPYGTYAEHRFRNVRVAAPSG